MENDFKTESSSPFALKSFEKLFRDIVFCSALRFQNKFTGSIRRITYEKGSRNSI